ncbi:MAG: quinone-dependent dihydroorotate dehydrogenase [Sinobacterium sp.]|nr:quinone-dependent dihydroorotate dehydrogenase [Sinobacterium sp.]
MYSLLRPLLFKLDPETAHNISLKGLDIANSLNLSALFAPKLQHTPVDIMGLSVKNPIGLAAGLDKNADHIDALASLGFGFIEVGTVTPRPQAGNMQPRLFRLAEHEAIINRMGFNNEGIDYLIANVKRSNYRGILGINIGKNKDTPNENAVDDYLICLEKAYPHASYITVNLSSPNTPGLRDLQFGDPLKQLLATLKERQDQLCTEHGRYVPIAIKVAPDMAESDIDDVSSSLIEYEIDGLIATNTTISREAVQHHKFGSELGGLSGAPVAQLSTQTIAAFKQRLDGKVPMIGVGGITNAQTAQEKVEAGADVLQIYTGFIYKGPQLIADALDGFNRAQK